MLASSLPWSQTKEPKHALPRRVQTTVEVEHALVSQPYSKQRRGLDIQFSAQWQGISGKQLSVTKACCRWHNFSAYQRRANFFWDLRHEHGYGRQRCAYTSATSVARYFAGIALACLFLIGLAGCKDSESTNAASSWSRLYSSGRTLLERGDHLGAAQEKAERGIHDTANRDRTWNWKFRVLKAEIAGWRDDPKEALASLSVAPPPELSTGEFAVRAKLARGLAYIDQRQNLDAQRTFREAEQLASETARAMLDQVALYKGILASNEQDYAVAEKEYLRALELARQQDNRFVETNALSNLGFVATKTGHFDEAIDLALECLSIARDSGYTYQEHISLSNLGDSYLELGDLPKALANYSQEENIVDSFEPALKSRIFQSLGAAYRAQEDYSSAESYYRKAYEVSEAIQKAGSSEKYFMAQILEALAEVELDAGNLGNAQKYNAQAQALQEHEPAFDLTNARIEIVNGDLEKAQLQLGNIIKDDKANIFIRWQAQAELASLYVAQNDVPRADRQFQKAIADFENTHIPFSDEENKMAFFQKAARVYDQYISLLIAGNKPFEALKIAESNRAHTLAEGLARKNRVGPGTMQLANIQGFLGKRHSVALAYWLGNQRSIGWVITPTGFQFFTLPARREIARLVDRYNRELQHSGDDGMELGQKLYGLLVQPAEKFISHGSHIIRIADGSLSQLNFEALVPSNPAPHYWIDDVEVENASSLPLYLRAAAGEPQHARDFLSEKLLLLGAPAEASKEYPALVHANQEIALVENHFPQANRTTITGKDATPSKYPKSHPEQYGVIHFATHGIASEISPLDSAIILAPEPENNAHRYKLYAREIVKQPLSAELVTISACSGAGRRTYSGEGLVGLAWSFLRAGAHHVIAGLWDVDDAASPDLMDRFYTELSNDRSPATALRAAKRAMLHSGTVRRDPYYWASLQLYTGS